MRAHESQSSGLQPKADASQANPFAPRPFETTFPGQQIAVSKIQLFSNQSHQRGLIEPAVAPTFQAQPQSKKVEIDWNRVNTYPEGQPPPISSVAQAQLNNAEANTIQRFAVEDVTRTSFSLEALSDFSYGELNESFRVLKNHIESLDPSGSEYAAAQNNLYTIRAALAQQDLNRAGSDVDMQQAVTAELIDFTRQQLETYPTLVQAFIQQTSPADPAEKVRILGEVSAKTARMEFLLGTIYHRGGSWESSSNRGYMVDQYTGKKGKQEGYQWCSRFATTVLAMASGKSSLQARSGYRIANPEDFSNTLDYDTDQGGAFVGTSSSRNASANSSSRAHNPWASLKQTLTQIETGTITDQTKEEAVDSFFENNIRPQAGDIMVLRRSSSNTNSFSQKFQSHTTMIEKLSGYTLHTIEGNKGDRVTGRTFDLTDPGDVEEIVFISRSSLNSFTTTEGETQTNSSSSADEATNENEADASEATSNQSGHAADQITEYDLVQPLDHINQLLEGIAAQEGVIQNTSGSGENTVASLAQDGGGNSVE